MSRRSRRKTLSHAEIENFLCDLGQDDEPKKPSLSSSSSSSSSSLSSSASYMEGSKEVENGREQLEAVASGDEEEGKKYRAKVVRAFQKDYGLSDRKQNTMEMQSYAKIIHEEANYPLIPVRQIFPENFEHPVSSLESKKAILLGMQPMLSAAEKQRKIDSDELEDFTRCKVGKSRSRATYEYVDIDTNMRISGSEYARRYLLFLNKKKKIETDSITMEIPPASIESITVESSSENVTTVATDDDLNFLMHLDDMESANKPSKSKSSKSKSGKREGVSSRRQTLSPSSTQAILEEELEETNADAVKSESLSRSRRRTLSPATTQALLHEEIMSSDPINDTQDEPKEEPEAISATSINETVNTPENIFEKENETDSAMETVENNDLFIQTDHHDYNNSAVQKKRSLMEPNESRCKKRDVSNNSNECSQDTIAKCEGLDYQQSRANERYEMRLEIAKWKYFWELASADAAKLALASKME